jgi:hypothetical protein
MLRFVSGVTVQQQDMISGWFENQPQGDGASALLPTAKR